MNFNGNEFYDFKNITFGFFAYTINKTMGKPFKQELLLLEKTYSWANQVNIDEFKNYIESTLNDSLISIGSGGSLSASYFVSNLHQSKGRLSKAMTPLELMNSVPIINNSSVLFLSASGKNTDILTALKIVTNEEPKSLIGLTLAKNTLLKKASQNTANLIYELPNPMGKDGFLATNSLVAFFTILNRAYGNSNHGDISISELFLNDLATFINKVDATFTFQVLYSGYGHPVAIDIESKFSEAALGNILYSDYRNYGHGRHHWLDKRGEKTCIIALITPDNRELALKTLKLLPSSVSVLKIESDFSNHFASIDLLVKSFYLVNSIGNIQQIDPGRPGVPEFGRKLYHLQYISTLKKADIDVKVKVAIQRKLGTRSFYSLSLNERDEWELAYNAYKNNLESKKYGGVIFDYDGTLCSDCERLTGINTTVSEALNELLSKDIIIGIATGRGKSVRVDLQKKIKKAYHKNIIIGYYNGAEIGTLDNAEIPKKNDESESKILQSINKLISQKFGKNLKIELRAKQLTIEFSKESYAIKNQIQEYIDSNNFKGIACVQSSHSIDIVLKPDVSKLNVVKECMVVLQKKSVKYQDILCIGDKGRFPGNDYELLSHPYSLSVDETSSDKISCWSFVSPSIKQVSATLAYLNTFVIYKNYFTITL